MEGGLSLRNQIKLFVMGRATELLKEFGAKVKRTKFNGKFLRGAYTYVGVNITADINDAACESYWWEVDTTSDNTSAYIRKSYSDYNTYDTKADLVWVLFNHDQDMSENPEKYIEELDKMISNNIRQIDNLKGQSATNITEWVADLKKEVKDFKVTKKKLSLNNN
jgi:hypothetical protein